MEQENIYQLLRDKALADGQRFVYPYVSTGKLNRECLAGWLSAFNRWLSYTGKTITQERDYRRQFAAWFMRIDVVRDDPDRYDPDRYDPEVRSGVYSINSEQETIPFACCFFARAPQGKVQ